MIELKSPESLTGLLLQLADLSELHGYIWHTDYIRETAGAFQKSDDLGWDHLASIQFWGGSGSICDVSYSPYDIGWHISNNRPVPKYLEDLDENGYETDNYRQMELLSAIAKLLALCPITENRKRWLERAKNISEIYDRWLAENPGKSNSFYHAQKSLHTRRART